MPSELITLSCDTSGPHCAVALLSNNSLLASRALDVNRGQAEHLAPMVQEILAQHNMRVQDIDRIGVGVGPGNYTGIRIAVSFARGLALSLSCPAVGVNSFEATYRGHSEERLVIVPALRDDVYVQRHPNPQQPPEIVPRASLNLQNELVIERLPPQALVEQIGKIAALAPTDDITPPAPLYVMPVNAAPAREQGPRILA